MFQLSGFYCGARAEPESSRKAAVLALGRKTLQQK